MKKLILLLVCASSVAQSITKTIQLLPDTGQTASYTNTFGEDHDYLINPPSYTNNNNGTITDNVTGLMWQQVDGGEMTIENAQLYCDNLTLAGYSDWRLPSPLEAFSILNHQNNNPAMNTTYFTASDAEYWWTNAFQVGDPTKVWCTNAGGGIGNKPKTETISAGFNGTKRYHVRAVRNINTPGTLAHHFTDNGDGTITDHLTQLIWQKVPGTNTQTWENAIVYAESLTLGGATDWRLPNIKELQSLNDESVSNPSANTTFFPTIGIHNYWSATSLPNQTTKAWYWNTQFGITSYDLKTNQNYVLCVRGNPSLLAVQLPEKDNKSKVFPNPFSRFIQVEGGNREERYFLFDSTGSCIFNGQHIEKVDFSGLPVGIYFLRTGDAGSAAVKLIKE